MEKNISLIPVDDVALVYGEALSIEKAAVSAVLHSEKKGFAVQTLSHTVIADIDIETSLRLVLALLSNFKQYFGHNFVRSTVLGAVEEMSLSDIEDLLLEIHSRRRVRSKKSKP